MSINWAKETELPNGGQGEE